MSSWIPSIRFSAIRISALLACVACAGTSYSREGYWQGDVSNAWNTAGNWLVVGGPGAGFVPEVAGGINARAVIGSDNASGVLNCNTTNCPVISDVLPGNKATIGGLYLGTRERVSPAGAFVNPAPAAGTLIGALTISAGSLSNVSTTEATTAGADGRIYVGQDGRGYLTMTGGTLSGTALVVGGEDIATDNGTSIVDLQGSSTLTVNGTTTLGRRFRIQGPSVNFTSSGTITFQSTNTYIAAITSPTAHSPIKTPGSVLLGGNLVVEYSGAAPAIGQTWNLVDYAGGLGNNFANLSPGGDVQITGVPTPQLGEAYRLRKTNGGTHGKLLQLVHDAIPVLVVNRDTGELSINNPFNGAVQLESYEIRSPRGSLLSSYKGISGAPAEEPGWMKSAQNSSTKLIEVKAFGNLNLSGHPSISLGDDEDGEQGFDKYGVASDINNFGQDGEDLEFFYTTPHGVFGGHIQYVGTTKKFENNLVLRVLNSGEAYLKNDSLETLSFDGYSIMSSTDSLDSAGWGGLGGTWLKTEIEPATLSETNLDGSITLEPGEEAFIGDIGAFSTAADRDGLSMEFILSSALGAPPGAPEGDYNVDGIIDAADYVLARHGGLDETVWQANFGATDSEPPVETAFRVGSVVFDTGGGGGSAVPEPGTFWLMLLSIAGVIVLCPVRGQRRQLAFAPAVRNVNYTLIQSHDGAGECTMSRRFGYCLTFTLCAGAALLTARPAAAIEGIELVNYDFTDPGPPNIKVLAFDAMGVPVANAIPGWIFTGPGVEDFGHAGVLGDSGTDGGPAGNNELILSTRDGKVYQDAPDFSIHSITQHEIYKFSFDARQFNSVNADGQTVENGSELTVKYYYGGNRDNVLATQVIHPTTVNVRYELLIPHNSGLLTGVLGQTIGIEFDDTSIEYSDANELGVAKSWVGIDNVIMEIAPVLTGDFNIDGSLTSSDYTVLKNNLQRENCSLVPGVDGCPFAANGELTGDNTVDLNDFRAFKTLLTGGGGAGVIMGGGADVFGDGLITPGIIGGGGGSAAGNTTVPEPSTTALVLLALAFCGLCMRRRPVALRSARVMLIIGVSIVAVMLSATPSQAVLLAYDPFLIGTDPSAGEYTVGYLDPTSAGGGGQDPTIGLPPTPSFFNGGWYRRSNNDAGRAAVQGTSIQYLTIPPEPNSGSGYIDRISAAPENTVGTNGRIGRSLATPWTNSTVGTYYVSWVVNFGTTGTNPIDLLGYRGLEFWDEPVMPNSGDADIGISYDSYSGPTTPPRLPSNSKMFARFPGGGFQVPSNAPANFNADGRTHLVVFKFQLSDQNNSDTLKIYLDPVNAQEPDFASVEVTNLNLAVGSLGFAMYGGDVSGEDPYNGIVVDDLRIADTYGDVLPPQMPIPGDADNDRDVDDDDFAIIMANMNRTNVLGGALEGDVALEDGTMGSDRIVSIGDFWLWKRNYGFGTGGGSSNVGVPEPSSVMLLLSAAFVLNCRASRMRRPGIPN